MNPKPTDLSRKIARDLLRIGAVNLSPTSPFTWASGRLSPVYCDNRLTLGYPDVRRDISAGFATLLKENSIPCDVIIGTATAGIPHASWLADRMELPMAYVRSKAKEHGRGNQIEGLAPEGAHAVVVEDLVSTGMSSTAVLAPLADAGVKVEAVMAIFTYGLVAAEAAFEKAGVPLFTLSDFPTLIQEAALSDSLSEDDIISLQAWYRNPARWSSDRGGR
ncbi:MAG: orotate phosphoribosyltransferase [Bacteroidetes bacterium]|nr:orotate phosphoribosyltransferase [Bacteroidota bacterium]MDA1332805.1 orotate phosphoribosyltransferase [Bacteroidota bacterium]